MYIEIKHEQEAREILQRAESEVEFFKVGNSLFIAGMTDSEEFAAECLLSHLAAHTHG